MSWLSLALLCLACPRVSEANPDSLHAFCDLAAGHETHIHNSLKSLACLLLTRHPVGWQALGWRGHVARGKPAGSNFILKRSAQRVLEPLAMGKRTTTTTLPPSNFQELGVTSDVSAALELLNCVKPLEIQSLAWPWLRDTTQDVAMIAEAGAGKTIAYLVPLIERMLEGKQAKDQFRQVLYVSVPTRDLETQVLRVAENLAGGVGLKVTGAESRAARSADIVVGTAGTLVSVLTKRAEPVALTIVLDEADFLLAGVRVSKGGIKTAAPAEKILDMVRKSRAKEAKAVKATSEDGVAPVAKHKAPASRIVVASATVPGGSKKTVGMFLNKHFPSMRWVRSKGAHRPVVTLTSEFESVDNPEERANALIRLCEQRQGRTLVFANSASGVKKARKLLIAAGLLEKSVFSFTPEVAAEDRMRTLQKFSRSSDGILVASGLAARGLDLPDVQLVIEFELASNLIDHVHRVGRTARAGREGRAVSLVSPTLDRDVAIVKEIERCRKGGFAYVQ